MNGIAEMTTKKITVSVLNSLASNLKYNIRIQKTLYAECVYEINIYISRNDMHN